LTNIFSRPTLFQDGFADKKMVSRACERVRSNPMWALTHPKSWP
jgi:hypothetical protein